MSTALALCGAALAAASGVPGLVIPRERASADRAAAVLLGLAALCAAASALLVASGEAGASLVLPWPVLGERIAVGVDGLSAFFLLPALGLPFLASVYALGAWPAHRHARNARRLRLSFGLLASGMALVAIAQHAFAFLAGWELMALSAFFSITAEDEREEVRRAGFVYLVCTRASTLSLVGAFALLHLATGDFALSKATSIEAPMARLVFASALVGFALKAGAMPLHLWLPGAHAMAPSHVSAVLSGVVIKMGIYGILRVLSLLPPLPVADGAAVLAAGVVSAVLGVAFALGQHQLKRLLAYHSIENIGIILMGVGLACLGRSHARPELELLGLAAALLHVWNHALFKALLFLGAGSVIHASGSGEIDRLGGLARRVPVTAALFGLGAVAICGLPPLNGFVSELFLYLGLLRSVAHESGAARGVASLAIPALALVGGLAAACFIKVVGIVFLGEARSAQAAAAHEAPASMLAPMGALALSCLAIGLAPAIAVPLLAVAARSVDPALGVTTPPLATVAPLAAVSWTATGLLAVSLLATAWLAARSRRTPARAPTWDCGYAAPSPRMQYTASSFADGLIGILRWALWSEAHVPRLSAPFPGAARLHTHLPDPVLDRLALPAAHRIMQVSLWLRWLQRGHIHSYVLYILLALVVAFLTTRGAAS